MVPELFFVVVVVAAFVGGYWFSDHKARQQLISGRMKRCGGVTAT